SLPVRVSCSPPPRALHPFPTRRSSDLTLINDVLWMEQNLRFHLDRNEVNLQEIGRELFAERPLTPETEARLASLLNQERGLVQILWLSAEGHVLGAMPPRPATNASAPGDAPAAVSEPTFQLARS